MKKNAFFICIKLNILSFVVILFSSISLLNAQINYSSTCDSQDGWSTSHFGVTSTHTCSGSSLYDNVWSSVPSANTYRSFTAVGGPTTIEFDFKAKEYSGGGVTSTSDYDVYLEYSSTSTSASDWSVIGTMSKHGISGCQTKSFAHTPAAGTVYYRIRVEWYSGDFYAIIDNISIDETNPCPPATQFDITKEAALCSGGTVTPQLEGSESGNTYRVYKWSDNTQVGGNIAGTGSAVNLPALSTSGSYYLTYEKACNPGAEYYMLDDEGYTKLFSFENYTNPTVNAGSDDVVCSGSSVQLTGSSSAYGSVTLFSEDFNDWANTEAQVKIINGGDNAGSDDYETWYYGSANIWGATNYYIRVNSDAYGSYDMDEAVVTAEFDASNMSTVTLEFNHFYYYYTFGSEQGDVDVWNGTSWINVATFENADYGSTSNTDFQSIDITAYKNNQMKIRFRYYNANNDWYWYINDITVRGTPNATTYEWTPSTGLSDAFISNPSASPSSDTPYTLTATSNGCQGSDIVNITLNQAPSNSSNVISSTSNPPKNSEDISVSVSTSDPESETVYNGMDWRVNGESYAVQNFSFDASGNDGLTSNSTDGGTLTAYGDAVQVAGISGKAYEFDGVSDYLQNTSISLDPSNGMSISMWVYNNSLAGSSGGDAYHKWINLGPGEQMVMRNSFVNGVECYVKTGGDLSGWCNGCATSDFIYKTGQVYAGVWNHWVFTFDPNNAIKLYKDGNLVHSATPYAGGLSTIADITLSNGSSTGFDGKIDEVLVFEKPISAAQVAALYNSGSPNYSTIVSEETSCGETWTLASSPTDECGNQGSTTISSGLTVANVAVTTADVTDGTTCGLTSMAVDIDDSNDQGIWSCSPAGAVSFTDASSPSTTISRNLKNSDITVTWTPNNTSCPADNVVVKFNEVDASSISADISSNDSYIWSGSSNTTWSTVANWYKYDGTNWNVPVSSPGASDKVFVLDDASQNCIETNDPSGSGTISSLTIKSGANLTLNGTLTVNNDFLNEGTVDLSSRTLDVKGNFTNNGTLTEGTGTVSLTGSSAQTVAGSDLGFYNLTVNNSNGMSLSNDASVSNTLTLTDGTVSLGTSNLTMGASSNAIAGTPTSSNMILTSGSGELRKEFTALGSYVFPVGTTGEYTPATLTFTAATFSGTEHVGVRVEDSRSSNMNTQVDTYINRNWIIEPSAGISGYVYDVDLEYVDADFIPGTYTEGDITPIKYSGGQWYQAEGMNSVFSNAINQGVGFIWTFSNVMQWSGLTTFSEFGGGAGQNQPLPVELTSFNGACDNGVISLAWETASENNSSHFDLEKSRDGENWTVLSTISAAGTSNEIISYEAVDHSATEGNNYFRLRQVDIDGTEKLYEPINVSCSENAAQLFTTYPNPSNNTFQVIINNKDLVGECVLNMVDAQGKVIERRAIEVKSGINMFVMNQNLNPGMYFLNVSNGSNSTPVIRHSMK